MGSVTQNMKPVAEKTQNSAGANVAARSYRTTSCPRAGEAPNQGNGQPFALFWPRDNYVFDIAWPTRFFPSDQIAPGTRWLSAMTDSKLFKIQSQSESEITSAGKSLIVWPA